MSPAGIVAIVGPTASGKSDLAMEAARRHGGEIVSCDSVQVYRGLDVGSGKPSRSDREEIPHHLIDILDVREEMNAGVFAERGARAIEEIISRDRLPIVTGGTGLYFTALLKGLFVQGASSPALRARLESLAASRGPRRLHRLLAHKDPDYSAKTQPADRIRVIRALEVCFSTGRAFSRIQEERRPSFAGPSLMIGLDPGREELRRRVSARIARMLSDGLVGETRRALEAVDSLPRPPRPLSAIGYRSVLSRLVAGPLAPEGDDELQRAIVVSTMQYAKRQMTYFRHQFDVEWFATSGPALERIGAWLQSGGALK